MINKKLSLASMMLRLTYTAILFIAALSLNNSIKSFDHIWAFGLIFFGIHLFITGIILKDISRVMLYALIISGLAYIINNVSFFMPFYNKTLFQTILALPMTAGELMLAFWLPLKSIRKI